MLYPCRETISTHLYLVLEYKILSITIVEMSSKPPARTRSSSEKSEIFRMWRICDSQQLGRLASLVFRCGETEDIRQSHSKERHSFVNTRERCSRCPRGTASRSVTKISDFPGLRSLRSRRHRPASDSSRQRRPIPLSATGRPLSIPPRRGLVGVPSRIRTPAVPVSKTVYPQAATVGVCSRGSRYRRRSRSAR
jgi:hypothetical protein